MGSLPTSRSVSPDNRVRWRDIDHSGIPVLGITLGGLVSILAALASWLGGAFFDSVAIVGAAGAFALVVMAMIALLTILRTTVVARTEDEMAEVEVQEAAVDWSSTHRVAGSYPALALGTSSSIEELIASAAIRALLVDSTLSVRRAAANARSSAEISGPAVEDILLPREDNAMASANVDASEVMRALLADPSPGVRQAAATALGQLHAAEAFGLQIQTAHASKPS
jgi:hypothetical protein